MDSGSPSRISIRRIPLMGIGLAMRRVSGTRQRSMRFFTDADIGAVLGWAELIQAIEDQGYSATAPARTFHSVPDGNGNDAAFLLKPGWVAGEIIGVKAVTVSDNGKQGLPMVQAGVLLFDGVTGSLVGACEANTLTTRRTAAASAVAANVSPELTPPGCWSWVPAPWRRWRSRPTHTCVTSPRCRSGAVIPPRLRAWSRSLRMD